MIRDTRQNGCASKVSAVSICYNMIIDCTRRIIILSYWSDPLYQFMTLGDSHVGLSCERV